MDDAGAANSTAKKDLRIMTACLGDKTPVAASAHPECHPAFEPLRHRHIASLNVDTEVFRHRATGAVHYHIRADSTENVFLVALRTVPMDSSGVAHVLEHTVLCGSERFPVRDPFFMMLRRSLNTFMNAFTASDWTAYPFATKNRKDFDNLLQVYLDAVFFARLDPLDFAQEGHRLELADPTDPASPLVFKGVVYNEMKGAMSSPVSTLWQQVSEQLYPTTTYHYNSGGDPAQIPDLSYEQLTAFYRTHYHPSNAVFMTYGDMSATAHQTRFEELALSRFEALDTRITVGDEQRYTAPRHVLTEYAADEPDDDEAKTHLALAWLLGRSTDLDTLLQAHLLSSVLLDSSAAPLRYALESTTLGRAPSPLCGLEDANREMSFVCGLEGSRPEHAEAFEALVLGVLRDVAEHGIEAERLEAALHQLELQQREVEGDGYPYGLHLMMNALPAAIHGGDPLALLNLDPALEKLREDCRDPNFIRDLVHRWLLDNPHRVAVTMQPDATLAARQAQAEASRLAVRRQAMSDAEILRVKSQATALAERQQQKDDAELLPKVDLLDVPRSEDLPRAEAPLPALGPTTFFCQPTNGLVYQQLVMPLPSLDAESVALLPLYTECLTELGVGTHDYRETQAWQEAVSGGVHAYASFRGNVKDEQQLSAHLVLSGKALARNHARLIELMHTTLHEVRFDEHTRIRELVAEARARREERITDSGHTLALRAASSGMSPEAALAHRLHGLAGIEYIRGLDDRLGDRAQLQVVADQLLRIHQRVLTAPRQHLIIGDAARRPELRTAMAPLFGATLPPSARWPIALPGIIQRIQPSVV